MKILILFVQFLWRIFSVSASYSSYRTSLKNYEVLRVTTKSHHDSAVARELSLAHDSLFPQSSYSTNRQCVLDTTITFHTKSLQVIHEHFEASECRLNTNDRYVAVLKPTEAIHLKIQQDITRERNPLFSEIEENIIEKVENHPGFKLAFYDFENLNYDLECPIGYFDIAQVKLDRISLEVELEKNIKIASSCGFDISDPEFNGSLTSIEFLRIPMNGTFRCINGRTPSCKRSIAQVSHAHYRILDD